MKKKQSLLFVILGGMIIIFLIPMILSSIFFAYLVPGQMRSQTEKTADIYINDMEESVSRALEISREIGFSCMVDNQLRNVMYDKDSNIYAVGKNRVTQIVGSTFIFWPDPSERPIKCVYIKRDDGQDITYFPGASDYQIKSDIEKMLDTDTLEASSQRLFSDDEKKQLYFILDYYNIDHQKKLGKIVIVLDKNLIVDNVDLFKYYPNVAVKISDVDSEEVLYSLGELPKVYKNIDEGESAYQGGFLAWNKYYHTNRRVENSKLSLNVFIPETDMYLQVLSVQMIFIIGSAITGIIIIISVWFFFNRLRKQFNKMEDVYQNMAASGYMLRMPQSDYLEFDNLEKSFNNMADNLQSSFDDAYRKGIMLQESESRLLAAQINPHFIFNVLESINMRCINAGQKDISNIVTDLAQLLRGNIGIASTESQKITFEKELEYVNYYMNLQKMRFGKALEYSVEYEDEEILKYYLPRLSIQPIVENAVVHGLEPKKGLGKINIRIWEEDQEICVMISDNGVGFDAEHMSFSDDSSHNHIAIANIRRRLDLLYKNKANLSVKSEPGKGTQVLLTVPMDLDED